MVVWDGLTVLYISCFGSPVDSYRKCDFLPFPPRSITLTGIYTQEYVCELKVLYGVALPKQQTFRYDCSSITYLIGGQTRNSRNTSTNKLQIEGSAIGYRYR